MELYSGTEHYKLYHGNMLDLLEVIEPNTISSIVTDPPYELNFMGKGWDNSGIAFQKDTWKKCLEVLKPGGYLLAFGGSRTYHRIAVAIEDAGFEIRDCIMWLYGSGFPKSLNLGKMVDKKQGNERIKTGKIIHHAQKGVAVAEERGAIGGGAFGEARDEEETIGTSPFEGWGTALKPSYEPIIVARKPLEGSCTDNVIKYGVGGINIDECRVGNEERFNNPATIGKDGVYNWNQTTNENEDYKGQTVNGRFPANTIIDEEVAAGMPMGSKTGHRSQMSINNCIEARKLKKGNSQCDIGGNITHITEYTDSGSVSRYFYCAKASRRDRDEGIDVGRNGHPTVKPTNLMQYLVRLVTPNGGTVLDPFNGSGSTGKAVMYENKDRNKNYKYIGIELTDEYLPIAKARIEYAINVVEEKPIDRQQSLFDL